MRNLILFTLLLVISAAVVPAQGGNNKPPKTDPSVKSTIANADAEFTPLSLQSDLLGDYINGTSSVVSQIQGIGDWELDMLTSATRRVNVNFNDLVAGSNPNNLSAPMSGYFPVRFITQCVYGTNILSLTSVDETVTCGMIVAVNIGADRYSLRFYSRNFPGSDDISVACTAVTNGKCSAWRTQSPNGDGKLIAQVYKVTTVKNKQVLTDYGKYRFSFDISFRR